MEREVSIAIFGAEMECRAVLKLLSALAEQEGLQLQVRLFSDIDELRFFMVDQQPDLVITLVDGTMGMEVVYLVRKLASDLPVFWFSDDKGFGMQSHRLECDYFSVKPVTREKLQTAFRGCLHKGCRISISPQAGGSFV